jgi:hypothetical protein
MLFKVLFLLLNLNLTIGYKKIINGSFLKKYTIYSELNNLFNKKDNSPLILNGEKNKLKRDFCKYMSILNNYEFKEYNFNDFILNAPYLNFDKKFLYVNDFLIGNGRIFNHYEEEKILHLPQTNNIIILQSDNIESIPFKDQNIVKRYKLLQFPKINKKDIIHYIYDVIEYYNYNNNMYILNWIEYNLENIDLEYLNMLLFEIDNMFQNNIDFNIIHNNMNFFIEEFKVENHLRY